MQAVVYDQYGDASVLHSAERPRPERGSSEILIEVRAISVNPVDYRLRRGEMKGLIPFGFPRIPGYDVAGVVAECSADQAVEIGDRVMAFLSHTRGGASAEYATCGVDSVAKIPDKMPFDVAAAIPLAGTTALQSLRDHGALESGQRVLVNGASGGVGMFATQIAAARGAKVDAVASGANEEFCRSLGAERFFDYRQIDFTQLDERWDLVFDAAGKSTYRAARRVLKNPGRYVTTEPDLRGIAMTLLSWPLSKKGRAMLAKPRAADLEELISLWSAGNLETTIDRRFEWPNVADAHRRVEQGVDRGKVVIVREPTATGA